MYTPIYIEINVISLIILAYIAYQLKLNKDRRTDRVAFIRVILATFIILLLDMTWSVIDGKPGFFIYLLNNIVNALNVFDIGFICYLWFLYIEIKLDTRRKWSKPVFLAVSLPIIALFVLSFISPVTGTIFYIDDANVYHRGNLYYLQLIISYGYLITASGHVLIRLLKTSNRQLRGELLTLFSFFLLPAIGGVVTIVFYGLPAIWPATALSLLMVFINMQRYQISTDGLTGLNNRRQFDKFLASCLSEQKRQYRLFLIILDVNDFKTINDTYGHVAGDEALVEVAQTVKSVCGKHNAFLARYGGDEFAAIYRCSEEKQVNALINEIHSAFGIRNCLKTTKLRITVSIGKAECLPESRSASALISAADEDLYRVKKAYKAEAAKRAH